eukprot:TRINITY_DN2742_c0_g1_i2.p1 TRINITY_DN2742_c0_g1~~TRINITY_DN2742_c0_g1_i2.p1  ORF type:complete len:380 (-),score=59.73 TRINITY_DN2742_c0_g1_i2:60-1199(-)
MKVCTLYAALSPAAQMAVFEPAPPLTRKVVLSTNIAETSVTINGIKYVVDSGLVKARAFNPKSGMESLVIIPVSKAAARQRAGRAGREHAGKCFRLYTEESFEGLRDATVPEIRRCNLASVILQMKAIGVDDVLDFQFIEQPSLESLKAGLQHLLVLGALDKHRHLTPLGKQMASLPVEPMMAKALLISLILDCSAQVISIVAMLSVEHVFYSAPGASNNRAKASFEMPEGDHLTLLNAFNQFHACRSKKKQWCRENSISFRAMLKVLDVRKQLDEYVNNNIDRASLRSLGVSDLEHSLSRPEHERVLQTFAQSFHGHVAVRQPSGHYCTIADRKDVYIHPSSVLFRKKPPCVLFNELVMTTKQYMREVSAMDISWLQQ